MGALGGTAAVGYSARSPVSDAEFRRAVDQLKSSILLSGVVGSSVKLSRCGREWKGLCPFHPERSPSFTVIDALEFAHCFGCGWHGDVFKFVMETRQCGFREAYRMLANAELPQWTPRERERAQAEERLERLADEQLARRWFKESSLVAGTVGEAYLRARAITIQIPDSVRFGHVPSWRNPETGQWGRKRPAIICGAQDATGAVVGVQRIFFVNDDPRTGKADCKLSLGTIKGAALRLGPDPTETLILSEGPEDGLSVYQEGPGIPVWVPFGTGSMPSVWIPPSVRKVVIAGQNNTAGRVAVEKSAIALAERGIEILRVRPAPQFDDWNDQLRAVRC